MWTEEGEIRQKTRCTRKHILSGKRPLVNEKSPTFPVEEMSAIGQWTWESREGMSHWSRRRRNLEDDDSDHAVIQLITVSDGSLYIMDAPCRYFQPLSSNVAGCQVTVWENAGYSPKVTDKEPCAKEKKRKLT